MWPGGGIGVVYEHELAMGQGFKNHHEPTKFRAEMWVRELIDRVPTTILRPTIVVGDSRTGETEKFDGPYDMLHAISRSVGKNQPIAPQSTTLHHINGVEPRLTVSPSSAEGDTPDLSTLAG